MIVNQFLRRWRVAARYNTSLPNSRCCNHKATQPDTERPKEDYQLVYKFPYILPVRAISRFKIYQTAAMFAVLPMVSSAIESGQMLQNTASTMYIAAGVALGTLYYISNITRKLACIISIHNDMEHIRIGRMTFWGNRRNLIVPINQVVPLSEIGISPKDIYTDLRTYDGSVKLYIPVRFGGVYNLEHFELIFGKIRE